MASLRASLRAVTMSGTGDLSTVVNNVNRLVFEASADNRYATFFFGVYDPVTRVLDYVNAGHNAPFIVRPQRAETAKANGEDCDIASDCLVIRLEEGGPVVGLLEGASYLNGWLQMAHGDLLIAFTDGISEAMNRRDDEWGEDRLIEAACKCTKKPAGEIVRCLIEEADTFTEGAPQHDDMTLAIMKLA
jgi:sigma-B regulation protein RsbU (phosphoserine phosphatase)